MTHDHCLDLTPPPKVDAVRRDVWLCVGTKEKILSVLFTSVMSDRAYRAHKESLADLREEEERKAWEADVDATCKCTWATGRGGF